MSQLLLEGEVDHTRAFIDAVSKLKARIGDLEGELEIAHMEAEQAKREVARSTARLRKLLTPYLVALKEVFGELDELGDEETEEAPKSNARWDSWKQRMPGRPAEFIDLLLIHGSMTIKQFMAAAHCGQNTAYQIVSKLGQAGVTQNIGGKYSLKT